MVISEEGGEKDDAGERGWRMVWGKDVCCIVMLFKRWRPCDGRRGLSAFLGEHIKRYK